MIIREKEKSQKQKQSDFNLLCNMPYPLTGGEISNASRNLKHLIFDCPHSKDVKFFIFTPTEKSNIY